MKLSIITTIYKAEKDLPRLLDSMMALKSPELEFFLIDNGSPDKCGEICKKYAAKDSRFVIYTIKDNIGYIGARNKGLSLVDGDYVGFCDSDDFLEPGGYDVAIEILKKYDCDLYITSWKKITGCDSIVYDVLYDAGLYEGEDIEKQILPHAFGTYKGKMVLHGFAWKQIFRRNIASSNQFIEALKPYEDQIFNIDVIKVCQSIYVDRTPIYNYIVNEESITAKLAAYFDAKAEWDRIVSLYRQKIQRATNSYCLTAAANDFMEHLYDIVLFEQKSNGNLKRIKALYSLPQNFNLIREADRKAQSSIGIQQKIVRYFIRHRRLMLLSRFMKFALNIKS